MPEPADLDTTDHDERDAASIRILGFFLTILGMLVLIGTYWAIGNMHAVIINAVSGLVLTLIGVAMLAFARRSRRKPK